MTTAVIVTRDQTYSRRCQPAFHEAGFFPVVVRTVHRAVAVLEEFEVRAVVFEQTAETGNGEAERLLSHAAAGAALLTYTELPPPRMLVAVLRETLQRGAVTGAER